MWGNTRGWVIAGAMAVVWAIAVGMFVSGSASVAPPTEFGRDPARGAVIELPVAASSVVRMSDACDAGPLYWQAIAHQQRNPRVYASLGESGTEDGMAIAAIDKQPEAIRLLIEATHCSTGAPFADRPESIVSSSTPADLEALGALGDLLIRLGLLAQRDGWVEDAAAYFEAAFAMGARLFDERLTYDEMELGLRLMGQAAPALARLAEGAGDDARAGRIRRFDDARKTYQSDVVLPMVRVLRSADPRVIGRHRGDVAHFAEHAQDRTWRVEAILALGRMRYHAGHGGTGADQRGATALLERLRDTSDDPITRAAATAALELTVEQYRVLGQ